MNTLEPNKRDELKEKIRYEALVKHTSFIIGKTKSKEIVEIELDKLMAMVDTYTQAECQESYKKGYIAGGIKEINECSLGFNNQLKDSSKKEEV